MALGTVTSPTEGRAYLGQDSFSTSAHVRTTKRVCDQPKRKLQQFNQARFHQELESEIWALHLSRPGIKRILDSLNVLVGKTSEGDRVSSLGNWVSSVELASDDSGQSHARRGNAADENDWKT